MTSGTYSTIGFQPLSSKIIPLSSLTSSPSSPPTLPFANPHAIAVYPTSELNSLASSMVHSSCFCTNHDSIFSKDVAKPLERYPPARSLVSKMPVRPPSCLFARPVSPALDYAPYRPRRPRWESIYLLVEEDFTARSEHC